MFRIFSMRVAEAADRVLEALERSRQRHALIALPEKALHDLGISRTQAWAEFRKPFWRK